MTGCVEDLAIEQALDEFRKLLSQSELDQDFVRSVLLKVKTIKQPQIRIPFLDLVVEEHENEIEFLHSRIRSYDFPNPKEFFQNLPSPSRKEIVLPSDLQIEDDHPFKRKNEVPAAEVVTKDAVVPSDKESLEETLPHDVFVNPVADYMEDLFNSKSLTYSLYGDQDIQKIPSYVTILIMGAHGQTMFLISPTISQTVCFLLQVLKWLHWLFHFT